MKDVFVTSGVEGKELGCDSVLVLLMIKSLSLVLVSQF